MISDHCSAPLWIVPSEIMSVQFELDKVTVRQRKEKYSIKRNINHRCFPWLPGRPLTRLSSKSQRWQDRSNRAASQQPAATPDRKLFAGLTRTHPSTWKTQHENMMAAWPELWVRHTALQHWHCNGTMASSVTLGSDLFIIAACRVVHSPLPLVEIPRDTVLWLVESYYAGPRVYAITTRLKASKMPATALICVFMA